MTAIQPPFASQKGRYNFMGSMALINAYAEVQGESGKSKYVILPCDGLVSFSEVTDTPCRGLIYLNDLDQVYTVHSSGVYKVTSAGTATRLGTIPGQDRVRIARNQKSTPQIAILCATGVYFVEGEVVAKIIDDDLPSTVVDITEADGYLVFVIQNGKFFLSSQNEVSTIAALDFATAEQSADRNVAGRFFGGFLFLFGERTIEPWKNTGNTDFPFEPMPVSIPRGLLCRDSIAECDNALMFIGDDGIVYRLDGFKPTAISNHEVERSIQTEDDPTVIEAKSWSRGGHVFYNITGTDWSHTYDARTQQWHTRESYGQDTWRVNAATAAWNKIIVGDRLTGNLYRFDQDTHVEGTETMIWKVRSPTMHAFPNGGIVDALHIDFLTGQGVTTTTAQGYDPLLMVKKSVDGGNTFVNERQVKLGKRGAYGRVSPRRLGKFGAAGAVWELAVSDPVGRGMGLLDAAVRPLKR